MAGRVGDPPGYRVFWLNDELVGAFTKAYKLIHSPKTYNYRYARYKR